MKNNILRKPVVKYGLLIAILLQILILIFSCYIPNPTKLVFVIIGGIAILILTLFSLEKTLLFLVLYLCVLPSTGWGSIYPFFKLFISYKVIMGLLALCVSFWFLKVTFEKKGRWELSKLDILMLMFLFWVIIAGFRRYAFNYPSGYDLVLEILHALFYGVYFLLVTIDIDKKWISYFFNVLLFSALIISLEFIFIFLGTFQKGAMVRITTQQPHIALIAFPYIISTMVLSTSKIKRIISLISLPPLLLMILICQQRALWIAIVLSAIILLAFFNHSKKLTRKMIFMGAVSIVFLLILAFQFLINTSGTDVSATLSLRIFSLFALEWDLSWIGRTREIMRAFSQLENIEFLFGTGFGSVILRIAAPVYSNGVDNSFAQIIWKMGLIGIILYLGIIVLFLKRCLLVYHNYRGENVKIISITCFAGFIGLLFVALTNRVLISYRFIVIWALLIGSIEILYRNSLKLKETSFLNKK